MVGGGASAGDGLVADDHGWGAVGGWDDEAEFSIEGLSGGVEGLDVLNGLGKVRLTDGADDAGGEREDYDCGIKKPNYEGKQERDPTATGLAFCGGLVFL